MINKNKQFIIKIIICFTILLLILLISDIMYYYFNKHFPGAFDGDILIGSITIFGIGFAYYEHTKSVRIRQQERAVHIAKTFSKHLVEDLSLISQIINSDKQLSQIIDKLPNTELIFIQDFLIDIVGEKNINQYLNIIKSSNMNDIFWRAKPTAKEEKLSFANFILHTLNELEVLCMDITSNAAGSEYIYPILHQLFLPSIKELSIILAYKNSNYSDRFYPNISQTYNQWRKIRNNDLKKERKAALKRQSTI